MYPNLHNLGLLARLRAPGPQPKGGNQACVAKAVVSALLTTPRIIHNIGEEPFLCSSCSIKAPLVGAWKDYWHPAATDFDQMPAPTVLRNYFASQSPHI